jgi:hypothetical protein
MAHPPERGSKPRSGKGGIASALFGAVEEAVEEFVEVVEAVPASAHDVVRSTVALATRFPGNALDYVGKYHGISVPEYSVVSDRIEKSARTINTPVREYLNDRLSNRADNKPEKRHVLKDHLLYNSRLLAGQFEIANDGRTLTVSRGGVTVLSVGLAEVSTCFFGKGTPEMLAKTIELLGLWVLYCREIRKIDTKKITVKRPDKDGNKQEKTFEYEIGNLQTMVDGYLGVDCNGFTGRFLKARYPLLLIEPGSTEESYVKDKTQIRKKLADIKVDDTAVFHKHGSYHHVAMVSMVVTRSADEARVMLAESRTQHMMAGGPRSDLWLVKPQRTGKKEDGDLIEGQFDVLGRDKEKFVKFVAPHSVEKAPK